MLGYRYVYPPVWPEWRKIIDLRWSHMIFPLFCCWQNTGGQEQYRSEWSRYTKGCDVVLYVVDAAAPQKLGAAKKELHKLLDDGSIGSTPMLVLANKIDLQPHVGEAELIDRLQLNYVMETPWMVLPISALKCTNIEQVVEWLTAQGK